jgi:predicted dehydrogenase
MESKNQLGAGLIGCGYQGQWLAKAAAALDEFRLTACTDPDNEAIEEVTSIADHMQVEDSAEALIARPDMDVVLIATPHHLLQPYALQAVAAGKHVLAEKPIALNAKQALELETAVAQNGVTYMAGYSFRYFPPVAEAKCLIDGGVIGEIQTISAGMSLPDVLSGWTAEPESGGGILGYFGCHMVDRVLWFIDDNPVEVSAKVIYHPDYGVDMTSLFQVQFERGSIAQFNICGSATGRFDFAHFCGRDGHLYLSMAAFPNYELTVSSQVREEYETPQTTTMALDRPTAVLQKMEAELHDFAQAVRENRQSPITVADGRKCLQVLDAVIASGKTGEPVLLA